MWHLASFHATSLPVGLPWPPQCSRIVCTAIKAWSVPGNHRMFLTCSRWKRTTVAIRAVLKAPLVQAAGHIRRREHDAEGLAGDLEVGMEGPPPAPRGPSGVPRCQPGRRSWGRPSVPGAGLGLAASGTGCSMVLKRERGGWRVRPYSPWIKWGSLHVAFGKFWQDAEA